jgi:hypothetical protein
MKGIDPVNLSAQFSFRATGNPPHTTVDTAISNCFPGLECDFRNVWRHIFEGIVLHEADNLVVDADPEFVHLKSHRLLFVEDDPTIVKVEGPKTAGGKSERLGTASLEWNNALASKLASPGAVFTCYFYPEATKVLKQPELNDELKAKCITEKLKIRAFFAKSTADVAGVCLPVISDELLQPGDLTQSLCSPWQNDYRECACYYWAASRPDYVNVEASPDGRSAGHNWMTKDRAALPKEYILDDRKNPRLWSYTDLFGAWQRMLKFEIGGNDYDQ